MMAESTAGKANTTSDTRMAISSARPFQAGGFEVEAQRLPHYTMEAYGFRVREGETLLAYSGDSAPTEQLSTLARGADLFVCEATLSRGDKDGEPRGHLSAEEALAAADGPVLLTHRPVELPVPDGVVTAQDGLVVEISGTPDV